MKLGFHYHVPAMQDANGQIWMPGYQALFVESLAQETEEVVCFLHTPLPAEMADMDFQIQSKNVRLVSLGPHNSVPRRLLRAKSILTSVREEIRATDAVLVRAPGPLSPYFYQYFKEDTAVCFLLVGNYLTTQNDHYFPKKQLLRLFFHYNFHLQKKAVSNCLTFTNNRVSFLENQAFAKELHEVRTTTLSLCNFFERTDTCQGRVVHLLYTGRLDLAKGLLEMVEATAILTNEGYDLTMHFVGWEEKGSTAVQDELLKKAKQCSISERVILHGKKQLGEELDSMYRQSDIYVVASKGSEGFPRTLWEAMANSLPCIASKVGSIPYFLEDRKNALLIEPGNTPDLVEQIRELLQNPALRQRLIREGRKLAEENTLEIQAKKMVGIIRNTYC